MEYCESNSSLDFGFGFNDSRFSDRVLRIQFVDNNAALNVRLEGHNLADWAAGMTDERQLVDVVNVDNGGDKAVSSDGSVVLGVKTLHINSLILAQKSPFFLKLFSNGMMESEQRHITLRISASEEAALMELLNFMYTGTLTINTVPALLGLLMVADKFEVASCSRYCCHLLRNLPMTQESALLYLDLPSVVLMADDVQSLVDEAKQFLVARFKDISKCEDEVMNLPLAGIEAILSSDDLHVISEDVVYDFVLKWARTHYQKLDERRNILSSHLGHHIRFPHMTCGKLKKILTSDDFDHDFMTKSVLEALFYKSEEPQATDPNTTRRFIERAYKSRPVKVVRFEFPRQHCVVYLNLKRDECVNMFAPDLIYSEKFHFGGQVFFLAAYRFKQHFGLILRILETDFLTFAIDYKCWTRLKSTEEYVFINKDSNTYTFTGKTVAGCKNMFNILWTSFVAENSPYFINGLVHIKIELMIKS